LASLIILSILLINCSEAVALERPEVAHLGFCLEEHVGRAKYTVYVDNKKVGEATISSNLAEHEGREVYTLLIKVHATLDVAGTRQDLDITQSQAFYCTGELLSCELSLGLLGKFSGTVKGDTMHLSRSTPAGKADRVMPAPDVTLKDALAEERLVLSDPKVGDSLEVKVFDPAYGELLTGTTEVTGRKTILYHGVETDVIELVTRIGTQASSVYTTSGELIEATFTIPQAAKMVLKRESLLSSGKDMQGISFTTREGRRPAEMALPEAPEGVEPGEFSMPGSAVESLTPILRWKPVEKANEYAVTIRKAPYGIVNVVFRKQGITGSPYTLPRNVLESGNKYCWNVQAQTSDSWSDLSAPLYFYTSGATITHQSSATAGELTTALTIRLQTLPPLPIYLHGRGDAILGNIADVALQIGSSLGSEHLSKYDAWYAAAVEYHGMTHVALLRAGHFLRDGALASAEKYIEESDRYLKIFHSAEMAAISTYQASVAEAQYHARAVYEISRVALIVGTAGSPAVAVAADVLYTGLDFAVTSSEEGLSAGKRQLVVNLAAKSIAKGMGLGVKMVPVKNMPQLLQGIANDAGRLSELTISLAKKTGEKVTEDVVSGWLNKAADAIEEKPEH